MKNKVEKIEVRARIAPSPTGPLHLGTARTALFNWLFVRQNKGKFILRIEDTDKERSKKEYENQIIEALKWLDLEWDEGPFRQSERTSIYKKYLEKLLEEGRAYYCYCSKEELEQERQALIAHGLPSKYSGHCRNLKKPPAGQEPQLIRIKMPETEIVVDDLIRNRTHFQTEVFGDIAIAKNLETPLYNFAAVVDDFEMKISHVIRGEDHFPNTPKQIMLQKMLNFPTPIYAHLPLILSPDRSKMSKRYAETSLLEYREKGYLPEALINFMALLGWHPQDEQEILSSKELIEKFSLKRVQKAGAIFNQDKLDWLNAHYIKNLDLERLFEYLKPQLTKRELMKNQELTKKIIALEKERMKNLSDFFALSGFFFKLPEYETSLLVWKNNTKERTKDVLKKVFEIINSTKPAELIQKNIPDILQKLILENGKGDVLWPLRAALSGEKASPDPFSIIEILGKDETLKRIKIAIKKLEND